MLCPGAYDVADVVIWYGGCEFWATASSWLGSIDEHVRSGAPSEYPLTQYEPATNRYAAKYPRDIQYTNFILRWDFQFHEIHIKATFDSESI